MPEGGRQGGAASLPIATGLYLPDTPHDPTDQVVVGVIDTGVVLQGGKPHPFIAANLAGDWWKNIDHIPADGSPLGRFDGHGTFVCGLIRAEAPAVTIHMKGVLDRSDPDGRDNDQAVANAIETLSHVPNLRIINMSLFGELEHEATAPGVIREALTTLFREKPDVLVVTAAGNSWTDVAPYPAAFSQEFDHVITVGAVDDGVVVPTSGYWPPKASFTNWGPWVDAWVRGVGIIGPSVSYQESVGHNGSAPQHFTGWAISSGTSYAAATLTGLLAQAMIDDAGLSGPDARARVFEGPPVPQPGLPETDWRPYLRSSNSGRRDRTGLL